MILFRGNDVAGSIADTSLLLLPGSNVVISLLTHQRLLKNFVFDLEFANSLYTEDNRLTGDPGMTPLPLVSKLIVNNISTSGSNAIDASFGYDSRPFDLKVRFRQIDPGFRSMGTYYMQNNIRNITVEPSLTLSKERYVISGSLGFQRDNLKETLAHQTNRTIGSVRVSANPLKWYRADLNYSNYDINQTSGINPLDPLSTINRISQTTSSISLMQNFSLTGKTIMQNLLVTVNDQAMTDHVNNTGNSFRTLVAMGSYIIGYLPLKLNLSLTWSYSSVDMPVTQNTIYGPAASLSASMLKGRLSMAMTGSRFANYIDDNLYNHITTATLTASYKITKKHLVRSRFYMNQGTGTSAYTETKGEFGYGFIF